MTVMDLDTANPGVAAVELLQRWQVHDFADSAATTTVFAVFGVQSPEGRIIDKSAYRNSPYQVWLSDIAYAHKVTRLEGSRPRSPATAAMHEHRLVRPDRGRCIAMTAAAQAALIDYYREKIALLGEIKPLVISSHPRHYRGQIERYCKQVDNHTRACERLLDRLGAGE